MTQQNIATMQDILDALEQNPDLQREFHKHVVDVIRNDDAIRQDLRKDILTEELLLLPARFTRLEEDVSELRTDVSGLRTDVNRISGQIANLTGNDYESKAIEQSRRMVRGQLDMESAIVIFATRWDASEFEADVLMPAIRTGRITRQEAEQVEAADSIVRCEDQDGNVVCAVIEISVTVQGDDRSRATERAEIFGRATGWRTVPFVVGQEAAAGIANVPFLQNSPQGHHHDTFDRGRVRTELCHFSRPGHKGTQRMSRRERVDRRSATYENEATAQTAPRPHQPKYP